MLNEKEEDNTEKGVHNNVKIIVQGVFEEIDILANDLIGEEVDFQKSAEIISNNKSMLKNKDENKVEKKVNNVEVDVAV